MKVQEFMTAAPLTIDENASLESALQVMDQQAIRHLPVVEDGHLVGVISNRDLLGLTGWRSVAKHDESGPRWVRDVMHRDVVTVNPGDDLIAAAVEVSTRAIGCLPVIEDGKLLGIISEMDLIDLITASGKVGPGEDALVGSLRGDVAVVVAPDATLQQIDDVMHAKGIRHVPVVDGDRLLGIISDRDMRRASGEGADWATPANQFMTEGVVTVHEDLPIAQAAAAMTDRSVGALVVTSEGGELGVVTTTDMLKYVLETL